MENANDNAHAPRELSGSPHVLEIFNPLIFLPICVATVYMAFALIDGGFDKLVFAAAGLGALILTGSALAASIWRRTVCNWRIEDDVLHFTQGLSRRRELTLRMDRLLYAEMAGNPFCSLFGAARVRLYSSACRRAFFSVIMSKNQAVQLINAISAGRGDGGVRPKHMLSGKYSALLDCATSRGTLLPLGAALIFCIFGVFYGYNPDMNIIAAALWLFAFINLIVRLAAESNMSVCILDNGFAIKIGIFGGKRIFVPHDSVVGVMERRNPIAALCGAARFELVCEGGKRIPCMRWYEGGSGEEAAKRLLNCSGVNCTRAADKAASRKLYIKLIIAAMFGLVWVWLAMLSVTGEMRAFCTASAVIIFVFATVHCIMALSCGTEFGITISSGTLRIGGMRLLSVEYLTIRRGNLSSVKIKQGVFAQISGRCSVELIPRGSRSGGKSLCVPYDKMLAITERFY